MMKLNEISFRYLKGQKKHTVLTILAIATATVFMTVMLAGVSVYRTAALNICEKTNGTYHVLFSGLTKDQLVAARSMDIFEKTEIYSVSTYTSSLSVDFGQMENDDASIEYLSLNNLLVDDVFLRMKAGTLTMMPDSMNTLSDGRFPEKDGELVLSAQSARMWGNPEIGDTVTAKLVTCGVKKGRTEAPEDAPALLANNFDILDVSDISFTVVGFSDTGNMVDYSDTRLRSYSSATDNMLARFSDKANDLYWDMHYAFKDAGYEIDDISTGMNQELLDLEGKGVTAKFSQALFFGLVYLVVIFIMFCVRMVIDNSFEMSSKERIKQFGLLKAVGASRKQVFLLVVWEAFYLALPGVFIGLIAGTGCAAAVFSAVKQLPALNNDALRYKLGDMLVFDLKPYVFISSAFIGFFWVFISAVSTGMRSIKSSPVEAMYAAGKREKIAVPRYRTNLEKGGSFIGAYSGLSIKRNKKRYIITMVSMVISIVMFASFSYGVELAQDKITGEFESERQPYDYTIQASSFSPYDISINVDELRDTGLFRNIQYDCFIRFFLPPEDIGAIPGSEITQAALINFDIHPINRETYERCIIPENAMSYDEFEASGKILICSVMNDNRGRELYRMVDNAPESITSEPFIPNNVMFLYDITVGAAGTYVTSNRMYTASQNKGAAIMAESAYEALVISMGIDSSSTSYTLNDTTQYTAFTREIAADAVPGMEADAEKYLNRHYYDLYTNNTADLNMALAVLEMIKTVGYLAIIIISLIAAVNIVNIISSNVLSRTPEFAMLRACGMSDKQLHKLILTESLIYAFLASLISLLVVEGAVTVIQIPFKAHINDLYLEDLGLTFSAMAPLKYIAAAAAAAFLTAAAASWFPARRIINSPIVENIRNMET